MDLYVHSPRLLGCEGFWGPVYIFPAWVCLDQLVIMGVGAGRGPGIGAYVFLSS